MARSSKEKKLSAAQQFLFLNNSNISGGTGTLTKGKLVWWFKAQPSPMSREYDVQVIFEESKVPKVTVLEPQITLLANGRDIPHIYHDPVRLCLYLPRKHQWHSGLRIDQTIIPWTFLWLYYFEEWLATDHWKGEGEHPNSNSNTDVEGNRKLRRMARKL